jgi:hypothetical protein
MLLGFGCEIMNVKVGLALAFIVSVIYYRATVGPVENPFVVMMFVLTMLALPFMREDANMRERMKRGLK